MEGNAGTGAEKGGITLRTDFLARFLLAGVDCRAMNESQKSFKTPQTMTAHIMVLAPRAMTNGQPGEYLRDAADVSFASSTAATRARGAISRCHLRPGTQRTDASVMF